MLPMCIGYLPPPIRPSQLAQRLLQQTKFDRLAEDSGEVQDVEMEVEDQESDVTSITETKKDDKAKQVKGRRTCTISYEQWGTA